MSGVVEMIEQAVKQAVKLAEAVVYEYEEYGESDGEEPVTVREARKLLAVIETLKK